MKKEEIIQIAVCNYLRLQYPDVLFVSDMAAGMRLTIGQAVKAKKMRSSRGLPDLIILEPKGDYYHGLCLELKKEGTKLFKRNGEWATPHLQEQFDCLVKLRDKGYLAEFAIGFDEAKETIDEYLQ